MTGLALIIGLVAALVVGGLWFALTLMQANHPVDEVTHDDQDDDTPPSTGRIL